MQFSHPGNDEGRGKASRTRMEADYGDYFASGRLRLGNEGDKRTIASLEPITGRNWNEVHAVLDPGKI